MGFSSRRADSADVLRVDAAGAPAGNPAQRLCSGLSPPLLFMIWDQDIAWTLMLELGVQSSANVLGLDGPLDF